jgi:hypothetical protein
MDIEPEDVKPSQAELEVAEKAAYHTKKTDKVEPVAASGAVPSSRGRSRPAHEPERPSYDPHLQTHLDPDPNNRDLLSMQHRLDEAIHANESSNTSLLDRIRSIQISAHQSHAIASSAYASIAQTESVIVRELVKAKKDTQRAVTETEQILSAIDLLTREVEEMQQHTVLRKTAAEFVGAVNSLQSALSRSAAPRAHQAVSDDNRRTEPVNVGSGKSKQSSSTIRAVEPSASNQLENTLPKHARSQTEGQTLSPSVLHHKDPASTASSSVSKEQASSQTAAEQRRLDERRTAEALRQAAEAEKLAQLERERQIKQAKEDEVKREQEFKRRREAAQLAKWGPRDSAGDLLESNLAGTAPSAPVGADPASSLSLPAPYPSSLQKQSVSSTPDSQTSPAQKQSPKALTSAAGSQSTTLPAWPERAVNPSLTTAASSSAAIHTSLVQPRTTPLSGGVILSASKPTPKITGPTSPIQNTQLSGGMTSSALSPLSPAEPLVSHVAGATVVPTGQKQVDKSKPQSGAPPKKHMDTTNTSVPTAGASNARLPKAQYTANESSQLVGKKPNAKQRKKNAARSEATAGSAEQPAAIAISQRQISQSGGNDHQSPEPSTSQATRKRQRQDKSIEYRSATRQRVSPPMQATHNELREWRTNAQTPPDIAVGSSNSYYASADAHQSVPEYVDPQSSSSRQHGQHSFLEGYRQYSEPATVQYHKYSVPEEAVAYPSANDSAYGQADWPEHEQIPYHGYEDEQTWEEHYYVDQTTGANLLDRMDRSLPNTQRGRNSARGSHSKTASKGNNNRGRGSGTRGTLEERMSSSSTKRDLMSRLQ